MDDRAPTTSTANTEAAAHGLKYRPEVDGLRAVAVIPVVLFHAGLAFPGGFVGVDVFFVISGYLITSLILKEGEAFSLVAFWERRVRRILPAAAVMVFACLVAGWFLLFPSDFLRLGKSAVAQALLLSNVFFRRDMSYFATGEVRPLLHTWSLAVEEQFYVGLPFLMYALRRASRRVIVWLLLAGAVFSLAASVHGIRVNPSATFYLLPTRAWELLLGSLIAALPGFSAKKRWVNELLSGAGLTCIVVAACYYTKGTQFPGAAALLPCLGAAAIIVGTASAPTFVGALLSMRPATWVGSISYSLYLWHWPLFAFAGYRFRSLSQLDNLALVGLSLLLAWLSLKFIEQPVRSRRILGDRRWLFAAAAATMAVSISVGTAVARAGGVASRWRPSTLRYVEGKRDFDFRVELDLASAQSAQLTRIGVDDASQPIELLVWGDSHAMAILHVADIICRERGLRCLSATHSATAPLLDFPPEGPYSLREDAAPFARAIVRFVKEHRVARVLLAATWPNYPEAHSGQFRDCLALTVRALQEAGAQVGILEDVPYPDFNVPFALALADAAGADVTKVGVNLAQHLAFNEQVNQTIANVAGRSVLVLDPTPVFNNGANLCRVELDGRPLYFDRQHLSTYGAMQLRPVLEQLFAPQPGSLR